MASWRMRTKIEHNTGQAWKFIGTLNVYTLVDMSYTGLGNKTLGGHKQNPVYTRIQEKGAVTP